MEPPESPTSNRKKLSVILAIAMVFAMLMGPGPGLRLVNPDIHDPNATYTLWGLPVIYLWGLFWFAIQLIIVYFAYSRLWNMEDDEKEVTR